MMTDPDVVAELDRWVRNWWAPGAPSLHTLQRARDEIVALREGLRTLAKDLSLKARVEALDDAANECDLRAVRIGWDEETCRACAVTIRALKDKRDE